MSVLKEYHFKILIDDSVWEGIPLGIEKTVHGWEDLEIIKYAASGDAEWVCHWLDRVLKPIKVKIFLLRHDGTESSALDVEGIIMSYNLGAIDPNSDEICYHRLKIKPTSITPDPEFS